MYIFLSVVTIVCLVIIAALLIKLAAILTAVKEINTQLPEIVAGGTNKKLRISCTAQSVKQLAVTLNGELEELRKKELIYTDGDREIKSALTNAAHDLRTPLTVICGYLDLLENEPDAEKTAEYIAVMRERAYTLSGLLEELFSYSVAADRERAQSLESVDMGAALTECLAGFYTAFDKRNITPEINIARPSFTVIADRTDVDRLFTNVINNALKYSAGKFCVTAQDRKIIFTNTVADMNDIDVAKLFDRFYTVKNGRTSTGLGLSIAKALTVKAGGKISAALSDGALSVILQF